MTTEALPLSARPRLPLYIVLKHDPARARWVLLGPERVLSPDPVAVDVLKLCDGTRTVADIAEALASSYQAPVGRIAKDVSTLLADLVEKGVVAA